MILLPDPPPVPLNIVKRLKDNEQALLCNSQEMTFGLRFCDMWAFVLTTAPHIAYEGLFSDFNYTEFYIRCSEEEAQAAWYLFFLRYALWHFISLSSDGEDKTVADYYESANIALFMRFKTLFEAKMDGTEVKNTWLN